MAFNPPLASAEARMHPVEVPVQETKNGGTNERTPKSTGIPVSADFSVHFSREWLPELKRRVKQDGPWDNWEVLKLALEATECTLIQDFNQLQCLNHLPNFKPYPHQIETAQKVFNEMHGRAILADEVGLGKTIEAGLIMKEYLIRGLAKKILILVPASLVLQWTRELNQKFHIPAVAHKKPYMWQSTDIVVASIDTAKRDPNREMILCTAFDMLIIDEAHKLKNPKTKNYQFVQQINKKYCLLLTATPLQNNLKELFNLISLLKPGQLGSEYVFAQQYMLDERIPKNERVLKQMLAKVMIRNRRIEHDLPFPNRSVQSIFLDLSSAEQELYDAVTHFVRNQYSREKGLSQNNFSLITLQREVCSSRDAVFVSMVNLFKKLPDDSPLREEIFRLVKIAKKVKQHSKGEKTIELLKEIGEKVIIFTEYRATQEFLLKLLAQEGIRAVPYRGGFNRGKKDWMKDLFQNRAQVMVATEAGGEGINLQFCHHMINYDMPWNPMRVEQRIGRIHRLGQEKEVFIYNLSTRNTIEAYILNLLYEKINMFELVIGELDLILEKLDLEQNFEQQINKIFTQAKDDETVQNELKRLGESLKTAKDEIWKKMPKHETLPGQQVLTKRPK